MHIQHACKSGMPVKLASVFRLKATGSVKVRRTYTHTRAVAQSPAERPAAACHRLQESEAPHPQVRCHHSTPVDIVSAMARF